MATCKLPECLSNRSQAGDGASAFKGPCGLPDCRNSDNATGSNSNRSRRGPPEPGPGPCGQPGCREAKNAAAGKEVCLYRGRNASGWGRLTCAYKLFWSTWNKIQSNPFYWAIFKATVFFLLGLKLFRDLADEFTPIPKCGIIKS